MKELFFGTAGIPLSTKKRGVINGIRTVRELGLGAMELEFVRSVNVSETLAPLVKKTARENKVVLTCHAQYYVNLSSTKEKTIKDSVKRLVLAGERAWECFLMSVCFHAGYYMKQEPGKVYSLIKKGLKQVLQQYEERGVKVWLRPELTGKLSQFGDYEEILRLSSELSNVMPCIDFAHYHARHGNKNSYREFIEILTRLEEILGKEGLMNVHAHVSGINYTSKGERNHLTLQESDFRYRELIKALKEFKVGGVIISESPNIEGDALLMKKTYESLG